MARLNFSKSSPAWWCLTWNRVFSARCIALLTFVLLLASLSGSGMAAQQALMFKGKPKVLYAKDGWPIHISYSESQRGKDAPVVVLLHDKGGRQLTWIRPNGFAAILENKGYAVITVDLRKHGLSKQSGGSTRKSSKKSGDATSLRTVDYQAMVMLDMEAVKKFIFNEHQAGHLNMRKLAIVAPEMSAAIAISFAANDWIKPPYDDAPTLAARTPRGQDVQAIVFISPLTSLPRMNTVKSISFLKELGKRMSFLICVGDSDSLDRGTAKKLFQQLGGEAPDGKDHIYLQSYPKNKLRGTQLLGKSGIEKHMDVFLDKHLNDLSIEWRDRQSRL
jgi:hypothetical protein